MSEVEPIAASYPPAADLLRHRVILVTGAGDGIGRAAALAFARHGATLVLLGRSQKKLVAVYDAIEAAGGPKPAILVFNLETEAETEYQNLANTLEQALGRLDGLLHNAAHLPFLSRIDDYDAEAWRQVLQVNLTAPFLLTQACLPLLRRAADASLIFTLDAVAQVSAYWGAYGVSKAGLEGLMHILAEETRNANTLRVNAIQPCPTRTALHARVYPGRNPDELPDPEALMAVYLYLMGPDSQGVTGRIFTARPGAL
ncbi:MAG: YciK family oxidoreductase [Pseudomonadota bacterium]